MRNTETNDLPVPLNQLSSILNLNSQRCQKLDLQFGLSKNEIEWFDITAKKVKISLDEAEDIPCLLKQLRFNKNMESLKIVYHNCNP